MDEFLQQQLKISCEYARPPCSIQKSENEDEDADVPGNFGSKSIIEREELEIFPESAVKRFNEALESWLNQKPSISTVKPLSQYLRTQVQESFDIYGRHVYNEHRQILGRGHNKTAYLDEHGAAIYDANGKKINTAKAQNVLVELEFLLDTFILLCSNGAVLNRECHTEFFEGDLTTFFTKLFKDENYATWELEEKKSCLKCCEKLVELIAKQIPSDSIPLLNLLAVALNENSPIYSTSVANKPKKLENRKLRRSKEIKEEPKSVLLIHLLNHFGKVGGFENLLNRFCFGSDLSTEIGSRLLFPFIKCQQYMSIHVIESCFVPIGKKLMKHLQIGKDLTVDSLCALLEPFEGDSFGIETFDRYIAPILTSVYTYLNSLPSEELKIEGKSIGGNAINSIYRAIRCPTKIEETLMRVRQYFIHRLLYLPGFAKLNALMQINEIINEDKYIITEKDTNSWIESDNILKLALDIPSEYNLEYWGLLEELILFKIRMDSLSTSDLDDILEMQNGKDDVFIINVRSLLVKIVPLMTLDQYDHLFAQGFRLF